MGSDTKVRRRHSFCTAGWAKHVHSSNAAMLDLPPGPTSFARTLGSRLSSSKVRCMYLLLPWVFALAVSFCFCLEVFTFAVSFCFCREFLLLPWSIYICREFLLLPWGICFCRKVFASALSICFRREVFSWFCFCCEVFGFALRSWVLSWGFWFCRDSCGPP